MYPYVKGVSLVKDGESNFKVESIKKREAKGDYVDEDGNIPEGEEFSDSSEEAKKKEKKKEKEEKEDGEDEDEEDEDEEDEEDEEDREFMDQWGNVAHFAGRHREYERSLKVWRERGEKCKRCKRREGG
jgi:hypothetical protein